MTPLISIITINLNDAEGLGRTLMSISNQNFKDFELIVVDGGSTDGSLEQMSRFQKVITKSISERDHGIYDAMNKGWQLASGIYCLFLNSGDSLYHSEILEQVACEMANMNSDILYGDIHSIEVNGNVTVNKFEEPISLNYLFRWFIPHPASFIRRSLLLQLDGYLTHYHILSDWIFTVKSFCLGVRFKHISLVVSNFYLNGISTNQLNLMESEKEEVFKKELAFLSHDWIWYKKIRPLELSRSINLLHRFIRHVKR